jgi:ketosteroid isomerase-like protein
MASSPVATVRAFYSALEAGKQGPDLAAFLTEDAVTTEHPNLIKPRGGIAGREKMLAASSAGASLLSKQTYAVRSAIEIGDLAIVRLTWTGVIARTVGPFHEGQVLTAHIAQFVETREGRIASIETYDCYEPFA